MTEWVRGNVLEKRAKDGDLGGTMRLGAYECHLAPDSLVSHIYGDKLVISERHRHRYEVNYGYETAGAGRPQILRHVARWRAAGDRRDPRPSVVRRRAVPSGIEIAPV